MLDDANYRGHVPVNWFQRGLLTVGSAVMGLVDTHRHGEPLCRAPCHAGRHTLPSDPRRPAAPQT